ncbi:hypothetical protein A2803_05040 [Candidatus Woesebacteria bacterium RIFCSPHIGHO2_01_FULL_44_21]|uniref:Uncharacterized protein n=1 Tax=Candidatus Woesebacteria bacterium RIFCSPHIGHO2_01_FULL_44_21 TaxID=1802503 RepID=A0A1F7Z0C3_9BACT|nr:MAG: hypothetical protein A2803_05040 [Candidatus Woesebacteria bacterium RIFCSPHIGHO2_01_FULL_44_21]OGM68899.1 MAG: hypothetical protein A2897_01935 [Candidatus Woesebacteria bacterium RIFCSPLOWO2_01_FULL_44_24b]
MKLATNLFKLLLVVLVVINSLASYFLFQQVQGLKKPTPQPNSIVQIPVSEDVDLSSYATKDYVNQTVADIPEASKTETAAVVKEPVVSQSAQTTIIPISATYSTQSLDWVDVPNSDFYLDLVGDYGESAAAVWEAFIYEQHGNGKVFARLRDVTHSIAVVGSDLETNSASSKLEVSAGTLGIWRGKNLYRVQLKSEKGFPVYFNSGRLKITY